MVGWRVLVAREHFDAVLHLALDDSGEEFVLRLEMTVERPARQPDRRHHRVDAGRAEATLLRNAAAAVQQLFAGFLLVGLRVAHRQILLASTPVDMLETITYRSLDERSFTYLQLRHEH